MTETENTNENTKPEEEPLEEQETQAESPEKQISDEKSVADSDESSADDIEEIENSSDESSSSWVLFLLTWIHTPTALLETQVDWSIFRMGLYKSNRLAEYTGSSYAGDIKNGRMEGEGTYCFASGKLGHFVLTISLSDES